MREASREPPPVPDFHELPSRTVAVLTPVPATLAVLALILAAGACSPAPPQQAGSNVPPPDPIPSRRHLTGPLIPASTTLQTAWEFPTNPLTDPALDDRSQLSADIRWGFRIFINTRAEAPRFTASMVSCNNCHLNGGQRERALPLVGVAGMFPEYNRRSGRLYALNDRIVDCFLRSENATGRIEASNNELSDGARDDLPSIASREVLAVSAYITWLARGFEAGKNPAWRGQNTIPAGALIPVGTLNVPRGESLFNERCTSCHGQDGQGVALGDKKAGPLWGPDSWNDGAGAARVYTLAGIIRYSMPYLDPGSLTDEEAQQIAAFINSKPRPVYPFKHRDYLTEKLPVDSVYYPRR
jgi:thiosulfate dehydrogenase